MDEKNKAEDSEKKEENSPVESQESQVSDGILNKDIEEEMKESYLDYSMSVIVGRALPDVRDGLKPVHRRVLYTMYKTGLFHNKPFKKSATVVGNCMAKYHPHGDSAIYDTLVRLAQPFSLRYPLINGQGNFGSIDGDSAAAMRYTECKLKKISEELMADIDKQTVDYQPNFDNSTNEPIVFPSKIPNLLVNGSSGIAVGMATNIPPHNMGEICDGIIELIKNPEMEIVDILNYVKGPDFPTGATIYGTAGIKQAYFSGRGKAVVKAKTHIEEKKDRKSIIVTEIPYMVNKSLMLEGIVELIKLKKIEGIHDLRDESDKDGIRIVIELKNNANEEVILNQLYKHSRLQETFGIIFLSLINNVPKIMNIKEMMQHFIDHRFDVVTRRTQFELNKAEKRAHILEGLIIALNSIDEVIKKIKASRDISEAQNTLMTGYSLSEEQAKAILEMRLQKLASLEQEKIREEHKELMKLIEELKVILGDKIKIFEIIKKEIKEVKENYGNDRRTEIIEGDDLDYDIEDLIEPEEMILTITHKGYIKRLSIDTYKEQRRGGKGVIATARKDDDFIEEIFVANTHDYIMFFTNKGKVHLLKVYRIPETSRTARGMAIVNLIHLEKDEKVTTFVKVKDFDKGYVIMATKKGGIKKTSLESFKRPRKGGIMAITLDPDDELIQVRLTDGNNQVILATKSGQAVRFLESNIRSTGRTSKGVTGVRFKKSDDAVIGMVIADESKTLFTITENGYGKRTRISDYRLIKRGGRGVRNIICSERNGNVIYVMSATGDERVVIITKEGIAIKIPIGQISVIGRNTQGVRIMRLNSTDRVVAAAIVINEEEKTVEDIKKEEDKEIKQPETSTVDTSKEIEETSEEESVEEPIEEPKVVVFDNKEANGKDPEDLISKEEDKQTDNDQVDKIKEKFNL